MRFVEVEFKPGGKRYTYHHDGAEPIEPGVDRVECMTRDGPATFNVLAVHLNRQHLKPDQETAAVSRVLPRPE